MSLPAYPAPAAMRKAAASPGLDSLFGGLWPDDSVAGRPRLLLAALAAGLLAAFVLPFHDLGVGTFAVLVAGCGVVALADPRARTPYHLVCGTLVLLLVSTVVVRDAQWIVALCLVAAFAVTAAALVEGRTFVGLVASTAVVPLAGIRGLPWLTRSIRLPGKANTWLPAIRTLAVSLMLVLVFGSLFASADPVFAEWTGAFVPDLTVGRTIVRAFTWAAFGGLTLAGVYVALNPPRVERLAVREGKPVSRAFEWLVPIGFVVAVFLMFVAAQLTAMFGGHAYLRRTTGLTYAEYAHQGFGQLTFATLLTLGVVAVAIRKAPRASARDRLVLRIVLGALCLLTLVVVASALYRVHVYEQAYGFTRLRLLSSVFEGWLGLLVVLVLAAGLTLRGPWVPRAALLTGAAMLLGLAAVNPDGYIASQNLQRFEHTGRIDVSYLAGLSRDAVPALSGLRATDADCALGIWMLGNQDSWLEWNFGRSRARSAVRTANGRSDVGCRGGD